MSRLTLSALSTLAVCGLACLSNAQTAGLEPGMKPAGMTPSGSNAASSGGGYTSLPEVGSPFGYGYPNAGVAPIMRGFANGYPSTQTRIVQTNTEWQTVYLKLNQPVPYQASYAPDIADFTQDNLAVILLGQDYGTNCSPTVDSVTWDGYKTVVCYSIWVPLNGNQQGNGNGHQGDGRGRGKDGDKDHKGGSGDKGSSQSGKGNQGSQGDQGSHGNKDQKGQQGTGSQGQGSKTPAAPTTYSVTSQYTLYPYVVIRYQKHAGITQFVGRVQYFQPYGWGW